MILDIPCYNMTLNIS